MHKHIKELNPENVWRTCNKIRAAISRINGNLWDCFKPLDKLEKNLISESDFITTLSGPLGKLIGLSNQEICELSDYFRTQDGRIYYAQFCTIIHEDNPDFTRNLPFITGQEWENPLQTNCVSMSEERKLEIIITKIASLVNLKKLILMPYFQDYELISKNCGVVTFAHFSRVLQFLKITLAPEEMYLLLKKFSKDNYTMNYVAFVQAVEEIVDFLKKHGALDKGGDLLDNFPGRIISVKLPKLPRPEVGKIKAACVFPQQLHFLTVDTSSKRIRQIEELILRLQDHVFKNQLRVSPCFQDFDVFNVGKVSEHQFRRGLDSLRTSALGKLYLAEEEIENLIAFYRDPNEMEKICWRTFEDDIERVFTTKQLHKHPNCKVVIPSPEIETLPRKGYQEWECTESLCKKTMEKVYEKTFRRIVHRVQERRFSLRPFFRNFDKRHRGHISRAQLRQALATAAVPLTHEEILSLEFMYNNDEGFNYLDFMNKLEKAVGDSPLCNKGHPNENMNFGVQGLSKSTTDDNDINIILAKIKANVVCKGLKVNEFYRKFDKFNTRIIERFHFHRGLDQLNCGLTCSEVKTLMKHFASPDRPDCINYWDFSEAIEGAMAQGYLERSPLAKPVRHVPSEATPRSFLNFDERQILMRTLKLLSAYVDNNLEEVLKDFDKKPHNGTITKNQLVRALSVRKVIDIINANELDVLFKCFAVGHIKSDMKFDYISFLNALYIVHENKKVVPY